MVGKTEIVIHLDQGQLAADPPAMLAFAWAPSSPIRPREIVEVAGTDDHRTAEPMGEEMRSKLVGVIAQARHWLAELMRDEAVTTEVIAIRESLGERAVRMRLSLAFLAPDIVEAAVAGRLPKSFGNTRLTYLPMDWAKQCKALVLAKLAA